MPLKAILITADLLSYRRFSGELGRSPEIEVVRTVEGYPGKADLRRLLQVHAPDIVVLQFSHIDAAVDVATTLNELGTGHPIVAIDPPSAPEAMIRMLRCGVRDVLESPATPDSLANCVANISRLLETQRPAAPDAGALYCFLPAKPGSGTSVIAVNTALMLAQLSEKRCLLVDLDLSTGITSFFLKIAHDHSIRDAISFASKLDEELWQRFVSTRDKLDVLGAGTLGSSQQVDVDALNVTIDFARRLYGIVCVDLSGAMEHWSAELLNHASQVFLVSTQEVPALHLGRLKGDVLRELGVQRQTSVLLNRTERRQALSLTDIEKLLDFRVRWTFPNDYRGVMESTVEGKPVPSDSELGRQFKTFAASLVGGIEEAPRPRRRFLDFFSATPQKIVADRS